MSVVTTSAQGGSLSHVTVNQLTEREPITGLPGPAILEDRILHALAGLMRDGGIMALILCEMGFGSSDPSSTASHKESLEAEERPRQRSPLHARWSSQDGVLRRWREMLRPTDSLSWAGGNRFAIVLERLLKPSNLDVILERLAECGFDGPWAALTCSAPLADPSLILQEAHELLECSKNELFGQRTGAPFAPATAGSAAPAGASSLAGASANPSAGDRVRWDISSVDVEVDPLHCARGDLIEQRGADIEQSIASQLSDGFARGELHVAYQPIVSVPTRQLRGFEALLRWEHPYRGIVLPPVFIPAAERTGAILDIGRWVLEEACGLSMALMRAERSKGSGHVIPTGSFDQGETIWNELTMTVNLTTGQALEPGLIERIEHLKAVGLLDPERIGLRLEMDQSSLAALETSASIKEAIARLRHLGLKVGVDNFGLGPSSLKTLRELSISSLSMDRSLVERIDLSERDRLMAKAIVDLAHANSMEVIAEGVERPEQLEALNEMGCDLAEGFLFGRAMRTSELNAYLS